MSFVEEMSKKDSGVEVGFLIFIFSLCTGRVFGFVRLLRVFDFLWVWEFLFELVEGRGFFYRRVFGVFIV